MEGNENKLAELLVRRLAEFMAEIMAEFRDLKRLVEDQAQESEFVTPAQAAIKLKRAVWTVQQYLRTGALRGQRSGARSGRFERWVIHVNEIERFKKEGPYRDGEAPGAAPVPSRPRNPPNSPTIRKRPEWPVA
jgi:hypothetical protein